MNNTRQPIYQMSLAQVIVSLIMSILLWTIVTNAWGYSTLLFGAEGSSWGTYIYNFFSRFVWSVPAIVLLNVYANDVPTTWKKLFTNKPHMKTMIISTIIVVLYNVIAMLYNHGGLWINPEFDFLKVFPTFVMVAFVEEIVYRGWGLNALSAFLSERKANVISTVFFIILHLPAYFITLFLHGTFPVAAVANQCVFALVLGLLFGYMFRKGKCLWSPMLAHFLADFTGVLLVG